MIKYSLDAEQAILHLQPEAPLKASDFQQVAAEVDPYLEKSGDLAGLIIDAPAGFPGWENFSAAVEHFRFVRDHHKHIKKVAVVTDSKLGDLAEHLASHFVSAEIKHFAAGDLAAAQAWILNS